MVSRANSYVNLAPSTSRVGSEALSEKKDASFLAKSLGSFYQRKKNILSIYIFNLHVFNMCCSWKRVKPRTFSSSKSQDSDFAFEPRPRDFFAKHGEETEAFRTPR